MAGYSWTTSVAADENSPPLNVYTRTSNVMRMSPWMYSISKTDLAIQAQPARLPATRMMKLTAMISTTGTSTLLLYRR